MTAIAYVSTYVPQKCGLATYTHHLRQAVNEAKGWTESDPVVVVTREPSGHLADPLLWPLDRDDAASYAAMARRINLSDVDVVSLQHEFGIFGGEAGNCVLAFIRELEKPLVTTFHTVFEKPEPPYAPIQKEIADRSDKIIVMNRQGITFLRDAYGIPEGKIALLPHGTPSPEDTDRDALRRELGWENRRVIMTFGLLNRGKGVERIIGALPEVVRRVPNALYAVIGQTHPEVVKHEGETYREELRRLVMRLGLDGHVVMIDRYMSERELVRHLAACDLYVTPYPGLEQITSGTLAYAVGLGCPVLTTPYRYAVDLLGEHPELLIPYDAEDEWADRIAGMLLDDETRAGWSARIGNIGRQMHWPVVGRAFLDLLSGVKEHALAETQ